jgi:hypothetical protein
MSSANYKNLYALISTLSEGVKKMEKGNLNPLQVELLLDDARSLHERLAVIQYLSFEKQVKAEEDVDNESEKEKKKSFGIKFDAVEKQEVLTKQIDLEESIDEVLETNVKEKIPNEKDDSNVSASLNDRFAQTETSSLADQLGKQPIKDLISAIGLNEKFLFVEQLFNNDADAYKEQLKILNSMNSFDEAINYINNQLKNKFEWKLKGKVEKKFIRLIERRYL